MQNNWHSNCADGQAWGLGMGVDDRLQMASKEGKRPFSLGWEAAVIPGEYKLPEEDSSQAHE